jgi:methionine-rich copper-binding protein CopC
MISLPRMLIALPLALPAIGGAWAKPPELVATRPHRGGIVRGSPNRLIFRFSAPVIPARCTVSAKERGAPYNEAGRVREFSGNVKEISVPLFVRSPGQVHVAWTATFRHGATAHGRFSFTVAP